jgi:hypothetical protein
VAQDLRLPHLLNVLDEGLFVTEALLCHRTTLLLLGQK